ncbi:hypothetical protein HK098_006166 [Nowakowskiella sp. JEL0407]|nr:hypothetical protein HK098_006166 [Nowakowskiella sp. JEL0407]
MQSNELLDKEGKHATVNLVKELDNEDEHEVSEERIDPRESNIGLLDDVSNDVEDIDLSHNRIQTLEGLDLERFTNLKTITFRQNLLKEFSPPKNFIPTLEELDVYDNLITSISPSIGMLVNLVLLDLSFNKIKVVEGLELLVNLKELFFVQNRVGVIQGVKHLKKLENLEFGANKIKKIENLDGMRELKQLWLGKNKLSKLEGFDTLSNLNLLSIQSNRITSLEGLHSLNNLQELYISHNGISEIPDTAFSGTPNLRVLDISSNKIKLLNGLKGLLFLEEIWASYNELSSYPNIEAELKDLPKLHTVYFEHNPIHLENRVTYRNKIRLMLPKLIQIDATIVRSV